MTGESALGAIDAVCSVAERIIGKLKEGAAAGRRRAQRAPAAYGDFERESKIKHPVYKLMAALAEHEPVNGAREARPRVARKLAVCFPVLLDPLGVDGGR